MKTLATAVAVTAGLLATSASAIHVNNHAISSTKGDLGGYIIVRNQYGGNSTEDWDSKRIGVCTYKVTSGRLKGKVLDLDLSRKLIEGTYTMHDILGFKGRADYGSVHKHYKAECFKRDFRNDTDNSYSPVINIKHRIKLTSTQKAIKGALDSKHGGGAIVEGKWRGMAFTMTFANGVWTDNHDGKGRTNRVSKDHAHWVVMDSLKHGSDFTAIKFYRDQNYHYNGRFTNKVSGQRFGVGLTMPSYFENKYLN